MAKVKGVCKNIDNCVKADEREVQEIEKASPFVCAECGKPLTAVPGAGGGAGGGSKNKVLIIAAAVVVIGGGAFLGKDYLFPSKADPETDSTANNQSEIIKVDSTCTVDADTMDLTTLRSEEKKKVEPVNKPAVVAETGGVVTQDLGYAIWTGKTKNGRLHDVQGTLKFRTNHIIDSRDDKGRMAGPGDKVIGTFEHGHLTQGKWYKADGNIESIILGGL